ncbi:MAG: hypothetical protein NTW25_12755 [Candidatus Kapabacteria bacterium]|nr:hypothetical protein [Candidatus Kapabacteria bacterium]
MSNDFNAMDDDLQEPEVPVKKKKEGMSMPMMIGIGVGALILNIVIIIVLVKFVLPGGGSSHDEKKIKSHSKVSEEEAGGEAGDEEKEFFALEKERKFLELGRITTNPKGSSKFVVVAIGCVYRQGKDFEKENEKLESEYMRKLLAKTKSVIINEIGNTTVEEIQAKRSNLESIFRDRLKPVFKDKQLFLREIIINEFILQ